ncbi:unnamed protein product [Acanthoscelides obtectus]|uniref:Uncharacterized protein n=1 Tax=Acanthoscelides obtectus TaxID=200917 RepID=A0A9P0JKY4_ACAOB|nr:unnamed protein product [Acanthoscelides obtectus]CAK1665829.1 Protein FAM200B [Acanthoscelides obtectus]
MISTHCVINRQVLASKTLPQKLRQTLDAAIRIDLDSDHKLLLFHTDVRWLFKGNMLARLYELKEEVILVLEFKEKHDLLTKLRDDTFQWRLAYLTNILTP